MSRIRRVALSALVALALLGAGAALYPPGPTFNPQPDPPGVAGIIMPNSSGLFPPGPSKTAGVIVQESSGLFPPGPYKTAGIIILGSPAA